MKQPEIPVLAMGSALAFAFGCLFTLVWPEIEMGQRLGRSEAPPVAPAVAQGRHVYIREGCWHCHSQNVREPEARRGMIHAAGDIGAHTDAAFNQFLRPALWGTSRQGPDLSRVGSRPLTPEWHRAHLVAPRALVPQSIMPSYSYLTPGDLDALVEYLVSLK